MGGDYYDRDVVSTNSNTGYSDVSNKVVGQVTKMHSSLNPQRWKDEKLQCVNKNPIVFALDVTGSMGDWTKIIYDKMPMFYGQIMMQNYLPDPSISFCAIGDYTSDEAPLQVTEFGQGREIDQSISKMFLEGAGGGSYFESYELAAYFYVNYVELIGSELPFFFITGDESFYEKIPEKYIFKIIGNSIKENSINSRECWKELMKKFNLFLIKKPYYEAKKEEKIRQQWSEAIGEERILTIDNPKACIDVILGAIVLTSGHRDLNGYIKDMESRGQTRERVQEVVNALSKYNDKLVLYKSKVNSDNSNVANDDNSISSSNNNQNALENKNNNDNNSFSSAVPDQLICPITGEIFVDPVMTCDGQTYERKAIESWFEKHNTSPITNMTLPNKNLISNNVIKQLVAAHHEKNKNV